MNRILLSLIVIGAVAAAGAGLTTAFFSDTETSTGNTISAGSIDLQIDNTSYLNGQLSTTTSWALKNLAPGDLFFNFANQQPGNWGEDTISLRATDPAYACMRVINTVNNEVSSAEPELEAGDLDVGTDPVGELGDQLTFAFWGDDGDNVFENNESVFMTGSANSLFDTGNTNPWWTLTDASSSNLLGITGPIPAATTTYVGKYWCYGSITQTPETQDGFNNLWNPTTNQGFTCDGSTTNNTSQTDSLTADIEFYAVQSANNGSFQCQTLAL